MSNSLLQSAYALAFLAVVIASLLVARYVLSKAKPGSAPVILLHVNVNFDAYKHKELSERGVQIRTNR